MTRLRLRQNTLESRTLPYYTGAILPIRMAREPHWWESSTYKWRGSFGPGKTLLVSDWNTVDGTIAQWKSWELWLTLGREEVASPRILFCTGRWTRPALPCQGHTLSYERIAGR